MDREKMERAFEVVDPGKRAMRLFGAGKISEEAAKTKTWRDEIVAVLTERELEAARVTIDDVREAVVFFTATELDVETATVHVGEPKSLKEIGGEPGYFVRADGYRKGPAGP